MRVLIAEDEALIRLDLREMLEEEGHEVVAEARDGAEAIALAREATRPTSCSWTSTCPGWAGSRPRAPSASEGIAPVVMVTAFSQSGYVEQACEAGAMAYVVKPFSRADIIPAMQVAVSRFTETKALAAEVDDLNDRLETRKLVDRAKGLLMQRGMSEPEAFKRLQKLAMDKRKPLKDIAEAVVLAEEAASDS